MSSSRTQGTPPAPSDPLPGLVLAVLALGVSIVAFGVLGLVFRGSFLGGLVANAPLVLLCAAGSWWAMRRWERQRR